MKLHLLREADIAFRNPFVIQLNATVSFAFIDSSQIKFPWSEDYTYVKFFNHWYNNNKKGEREFTQCGWLYCDVLFSLHHSLNEH